MVMDVDGEHAPASGTTSSSGGRSAPGQQSSSGIQDRSGDVGGGFDHSGGLGGTQHDSPSRGNESGYGGGQSDRGIGNGGRAENNGPPGGGSQSDRGPQGPNGESRSTPQQAANGGGSPSLRDFSGGSRYSQADLSKIGSHLDKSQLSTNYERAYGTSRPDSQRLAEETARTIAGETGGLPMADQVAASQNIKNRLDMTAAGMKGYGNIPGVLAGYDAGPYDKRTKGATKSYLDANPHTKSYDQAVDALNAAMENRTDLPDAVKNATNYHNPATSHPSWGKGAQQFGAHAYSNPDPARTPAAVEAARAAVAGGQTLANLSYGGRAPQTQLASVDMTQANSIPDPVGFHGYEQLGGTIDQGRINAAPAAISGPKIDDRMPQYDQVPQEKAPSGAAIAGNSLPNFNATGRFTEEEAQKVREAARQIASAAEPQFGAPIQHHPTPPGPQPAAGDPEPQVASNKSSSWRDYVPDAIEPSPETLEKVANVGKQFGAAVRNPFVGMIASLGIHPYSKPGEPGGKGYTDSIKVVRDKLIPLLKAAGATQAADAIAKEIDDSATKGGKFKVVTDPEILKHFRKRAA